MTRIRSMIAIAFLASGLTGFACGGNKSQGTAGTDAGADAAAAAGGSAAGVGGLAGGLGGSAGGAGNGGTGNGGAAGASGLGGTAGTAGMAVSCATGSPQCSDGLDNDNDTFKDSLDPECQGPCDNDEGSFATGIPGDNIDACKQDCFFDGNSGMGDDGCEWNLKCDSANPGGTSCPYNANFGNCPTKQSDKCIKNCRKLAPNGCDCFGCCAVNVAGQSVGVMLVATCSAAKFGDPVACPRCTQSPDCVNSCDKCEICIGRPAPDPSCTGTPADAGAPGAGGAPGGTGGSTGQQCAAGTMSCGAGGQVAADACGAGFYCQTGCCVRFTID